MKYILSIIMLTLGLASCTTGTISKSQQVRDASYFYLTTINYDNTEQLYTASIDDQQNFQVEVQLVEYQDNSFTPDFLYEIKPGIHKIMIFQNGQLIHSEKFFIGNQESKEIVIQ